MATTGFLKMLIILIPYRADNVTANEAQESSQLWNKSVHELSIKGEITFFANNVKRHTVKPV